MTRRGSRVALASAASAALVGTALVLPVAGAAAATVPDPTVHYTFSETSGTTITDASGNGFHGTLSGTGASFTGEALTLPGGSSSSGAAYVQIPSAVFAGKTDLTISFWMSNTTTAGNFAAAYVGNTATSNGYWLFNPANPSGYLKSVTTTATVASPNSSPWNTEVGPGRTSAASDGVAATGAMAMYTTVVDGTNDLLSVYRDGVLVSTTSTSADISQYGTAANLVAYLGRSSYADKFYSGTIDDYTVHQQALRAEQVAATYGERAVATLQATGVRVETPTTTLPNLGGAISGWESSSSSAVVGQDGFTLTATLPAAGQPEVVVNLDAVIGGNRYAVPVTLRPRPGTADVLAIPAVVSADLPATVNGEPVTYDDGRDGAVVSSSGAVTRPTSGSVAVSLTATSAGLQTPVTADVTVVDDGGEVATYVKKVTTTGGVKDDLLAYADDRRSDALYVAARRAGADTWEPLNRNQAILYVTWKDAQASAPNNQMGSPSLFRDSAGRLALVASQNNATGSVYVWSSDGKRFSNQRLVTIKTDGSVVKNPTVTWDAVSQRYAVTWTDASSVGRVSWFTDLTASSTPVATFARDAVAKGVAGSGLPAFTDQSQTSSISLSTAEIDALYGTYGALENTGANVEGVTVPYGSKVTASTLPTKATLDYNDGSTKDLAVSWDAASLAAVNTSRAGTYEVTGTLQQNDFPYAFRDARADPHLFYNEDDGYYYLTGSHYAEPSTGAIDVATSYRKIGLVRSKTIAGLATAPESIIIDPDAGTPGFPNTYYGWGGWIWAQEIHKINGTWYILAAMNWGYSNTAWAAMPDSMVLIPYEGDTASIVAGGMLEQSNWGQPVKLENSPGFDVSYFEREENGAVQGYYVMPSSAKLYVARATTGPKGTLPLIVPGSATEVYGISQAWEYGKQEGSFSETNEGSDQGVVEAPFMFAYGDYVYLSYSGGTVDRYYDIGMLRAHKDAPLQDPASWEQTAYPVLTTYDTAGGAIGGAQHAGPGHHSFALDAAGNIVLAYHARPYPDPHGSASGSAGLFDPDRNTAIKGVNVRADGTLDLALTASQEVAPQFRTVTTTVTVSPSDVPPVVSTSTTLKLSKSAVRLGAKGTASVTLKATVKGKGAAVTTGKVQLSLGGKTVTTTVRDGVASATITVSKVGNLTATARYLGTATTTASSASAKVAVSKARSATSLSPIAVTKAVRKAISQKQKYVTVTVRVRVEGSAATSGSVRLSGKGFVTKTVKVVNGKATVRLKLTSAKQRTLRASYLGTAKVASSSSPLVKFTTVR